MICRFSGKRKTFTLAHLLRAIPPLGSLLLFSLIACSGARAEENPGAPPMTATTDTAVAPSEDDLKNPEWIQAGKTRFVQTCAYCHGTRGEAGKTRSFETRESWDPQVIHDTISNGRVNGPNVMPSWGGSIPDDMIWKIVAYIKSLSVGYKAGK